MSGIVGRLDAEQRRILGKAATVAVSVAPFGLAFGVLCGKAGIPPWMCLLYSTLVFTGGSQFAAVGVLADGGTPQAAVVAGILLATRFVVFGVVLGDWLPPQRWKRVLAAHLLIDESMAIGAAAPREHRWFGFLAGGLAVYTVWPIASVVGAIALGGSPGLVERLGIDATIPAAFLALIWPALRGRDALAVAALAALITVVLVPVLPPGLPVIAAGAAAMLALRTPGVDGEPP